MENTQPRAALVLGLEVIMIDPGQWSVLHDRQLIDRIPDQHPIRFKAAPGIHASEILSVLDWLNVQRNIHVTRLGAAVDPTWSWTPLTPEQLASASIGPKGAVWERRIAQLEEENERLRGLLAGIRRISDPEPVSLYPY